MQFSLTIMASLIQRLHPYTGPLTHKKRFVLAGGCAMFVVNAHRECHQLYNCPIISGTVPDQGRRKRYGWYGFGCTIHCTFFRNHNPKLCGSEGWLAHVVIIAQRLWLAARASSLQFLICHPPLTTLPKLSPFRRGASG